MAAAPGPACARVLLAVALAGLAAAGCAESSPPGGSTPPSPRCTAPAAGSPCPWGQRIRAVRAYLASVPGDIGIVLHDRRTGETWRNGRAGTAFAAASTIKLAIAVDLLLREEQGRIRLTGQDRGLIRAALRASSDSAADRLWSAYEGPGFLERIRAFGMTGAHFAAGPAHWGAMYCRPVDLASLMNYVLGRTPRPVRDELVRDLRSVHPIQRWGVWGAGPASRPGNKNGWLSEGGVWVVSTVGFAGPGARYTLAVMDDLGGAAGFRTGAATLTQIAAILFQGHRIPVPRVSATP